ncbi:MAG: DNA-3-methyladenine glycosylase 2 family protein [Actinobacteria bacterium]|nr:DNA-3-methyladenine glycosylase 2 family protein [Actinomycetota bacterium]
MSPTSSIELLLRGPGGEPVDFRRTLLSHGVASLPPMTVHEQGFDFEITLPLTGGRPRTVFVEAGERPGRAVLRVLGRPPGRAAQTQLLAQVRHILRLEEDLSNFYQRCSSDPSLAWVASGAGRMIRSPTVFEDVVKTICTTNCAWSATERMVGALVEYLGEPAPGAPPTGPRGRAFPAPAAMAEAGESFYRDVARAGYRGPYLLALARAVAEGSLDLEVLGRASREEITDAEMSARLQMIPGVGPYAAAHIMLMIGRYSELILDSWTRPTYARLTRRRTVKDSTIERRFRRYGPYAGLAFWLFLTKGWVEEAEGAV